MELEISPEPTEEERAAIVAALDALRARDGKVAAAEWWAAGLPGDSQEDDEL